MYQSTLTSVPACATLERPDLPLVFKNWRPCHHEVLTVELPDTTEPIVPLTGTLHSIFINAFTGEELYRNPLEIPDNTYYAVASRLHTGKYFVVRVTDYACSCYKSRLSGTCRCVDEVRQFVEGQEVAA